MPMFDRRSSRRERPRSPVVIGLVVMMILAVVTLAAWLLLR